MNTPPRQPTIVQFTNVPLCVKATLDIAFWFRNEQTAAQRLPEENPCLTCPAPCEVSCVRGGEVPVRDIVNRLYYQVRPECETPVPADEDRLKCDICGIPLENPFLLSSSIAYPAGAVFAAVLFGVFAVFSFRKKDTVQE